MTNQSNEKSKNGKRLALILLALLLIAAIAFGAYTYSKYVTQTEGSGTATVAKWGYTVTIGDSDAAGYTDGLGFSKNYTTSGAANGDTAAVIASSTSNNVVAPGAKGSTTFSITGEAEVTAKVTATLDGDQIFLYLKADNGNTYVYNPIVYTYDDVSGDIDTVNDELATFTSDLAANAETINLANNVVSWEWAFEKEAGATLKKVSGNGAETISITADQVDILDTALGQLIAGGTPTTSTIIVGGTTYYIPTKDNTNDYRTVESVTLSITITQTQGNN